MAATTHEILMWALMNRARLNPSGEGIDINEGGVTDFSGKPVLLTAESRQPLAWNDSLGNLADFHNQEQLTQQRMFHHEGDAAKNAYLNHGYQFSWRGENVANQDIFGAITQDTAIALQHQGLFHDTHWAGRGHRYNILLNEFQEVGVGQLIGTLQGRTQSIITQNFGRPLTDAQFLTGIAYNDADGNAFYSLNEGRAGVTVTTTAGTVSSATAGNYSKQINAGVQTISFSGGGLPQTVSAEINVTAGRNALVNLVGTSALETSVSLKALSGVIKIIGLGNIGLTLTGNALDNTIGSALGSDTINGGDGTDTAVFSGTFASYIINTNVATGVTTVSKAGIVDTLTSIERLQFSDKLFTIGGEPENRAPTVAVSDKSLKVGETVKIASWVAYSDPESNAAVQYQIVDNGTGANSGVLIAPNGSIVAAGTPLTVSATDLANVSIRGGNAAGTETMQIRAFDGTNWSAWDSFIITTTAPVVQNRAPVVTVADQSLQANQIANIASWVNYSDADNNPAVRFEIIDNGAVQTSGALIGLNGLAVAANTTLSVTAAELASIKIRAGSVAGSETMQIRAFDGQAWSAWDSFVFKTTAAPVANNKAPVAAIADKTVKANQWTQVSNWLSATDADGDAIVRFEFWDGQSKNTSGYFWSPSNSHHDAGVAISVEAANIANFWVRGGSIAGVETMFVRAFDGTSWGTWDPFKLTTVANSAPVVTINDKTVKANQWTKLSDMLTYSDKNGDAAVQYQFMDLFENAGGTSGYFWTPDNAHHAANSAITVNAADIGNVWVRGAQGPGWENMQVRVFDGETWSAWDKFKVTTVANVAPVSTMPDLKASKNEWVQASTFLKTTDANGDAITQFQFVDQFAANGSAYFYTPDNAHHAGNEVFTVSAADLSKVWIRGAEAAGWDNMQVRAFDGEAWGAWDSFKFTTLNNNAPVMDGDNANLAANQRVAASSLFTVNDLDFGAGDKIMKYEFFDDTQGGGSFVFKNVMQAADKGIVANAADLGSLAFAGGPTAGSDLLWARAFDGDSWSDWHSIYANTL